MFAIREQFFEDGIQANLVPQLMRDIPESPVPESLKRKEELILKLFVGIDVSSQELEVCCFLNSVGDTLETFSVRNNLDGASYLRSRKLTRLGHIKNVCVVI